MKLIYLTLIGICFSFNLKAQSEFMNKSNTFSPVNSVVNPKASISPFLPDPAFKSSSAPILMEKSKMQFINTNTFVNPGDAYLDKLNRKEGGFDSKMFRQNQYLGDFKSNAAFVKISYRDFGEVDGDEIKVLVNGRVVIERIYLNNSYQGLDLPLEKGFNKIEFEALNQGLYGPNTADFQVYDDKGVLISANQWNLATGFKASIIIFKE